MYNLSQYLILILFLLKYKIFGSGAGQVSFTLTFSCLTAWVFSYVNMQLYKISLLVDLNGLFLDGEQGLYLTEQLLLRSHLPMLPKVFICNARSEIHGSHLLRKVK
jgi:hypothetical protein